MRDAAGELHDFLPAGHFAEGVIQDLAVLGRDDGGELALAGIEQLAEGEKDLCAAGKEVSRQAGNAALAAATAAWLSSWLASETWPVTLPVAGFVTGAVRLPAGT